VDESTCLALDYDDLTNALDALTRLTEESG
jgi:hypothetical protein